MLRLNILRGDNFFIKSITLLLCLIGSVFSSLKLFLFSLIWLFVSFLISIIGFVKSSKSVCSANFDFASSFILSSKSLFFSFTWFLDVFTFGISTIFPIPVAIIVTLIIPSRSLSIVVPNILLVVLGSISWFILSAASVTSLILISEPPLILYNRPFAPSKDTLSNRGLEIAASAASIARLSPAASPFPKTALPISDIIVLISAKSKFISPGWIIKSVTALTPACSTWSAIQKASANEVLSSQTIYKFWFGITIIVST